MHGCNATDGGNESSEKKQVLGVWQGATENTTVVKDLLEDLVARGLSTQRRYLFVIDGAKALRAAIEWVFGARAEVQISAQERPGRLRPENPQCLCSAATGVRESQRSA
jgi:putative transposase